MNKKQGISLIVLVITIIVMIILAGAIILTLSNNGIIGKAQEAVKETNFKQVKELADILWADAYVKYGKNPDKLQKEVIDKLAENNITEEHYAGYNIQVTENGVEWIPIDDAIPEASVSHSGVIPEGATYYVGVTMDIEIGGAMLETGGIIGNYTGATATYTAGDSFPQTPTQGDVYVYGDYEYRYNASFEECDQGWYPRNINGWGVGVLDRSKTEYGEILGAINNNPITSLEATFSYCSKLIIPPTIPQSVKHVDNIFKWCKSLTTAPIFPNSITSLYWAFSTCPNLKTYIGSTDADGDFSNYVIPSTVSNMIYTFEGCSSITIAPVLPSSVDKLSGIFSGCTNMKSYAGSTDADGDFSNYIIPSGITSINSMFCGCKSITKAPAIPEGVEDVGYAFDGCANLTVAPVLPSSVDMLSGIFRGCTNLKTYRGSTDADGDFSNYIIPSDVWYISSMFDRCVNLTTAPVIPSKVRGMSYTFRGCTSLTGEIVIKAYSNYERRLHGMF